MYAVAVLLTAAFGLILLTSSSHRPSGIELIRYWVLGGLSCLIVWQRRRWPVGVGLATAALAALTPFGVPAAALALLSVAIHRRTLAVLVVAGANIISAAIVPAYRAPHSSWWLSMALSAVAIALFAMWGMFIRSRRQLVWSLHERAERAETEQWLLADNARRAERARIAREMHDVLGHRISLVALHAGGLEMRPDLPPQQVRQTAELLRTAAVQALEELRAVIGVLRDDNGGTEAPMAPQPGLSDIPGLVDETRRTGADIDLTIAVTDPLPSPLGRDAYRIVQESLTNVAKHAHGAATTVRVSGRPGDGLLIGVRNRLPVTSNMPPLPGAGAGLLGLEERVGLAGGTLHHGYDDAGGFVVEARLPWG